MLKALIIDDEPRVIKDLEGLLKMYCPKVDIIGVAHSAKSAQELIPISNPDIIFLDIQLDKSNGIELLRNLDEVDFQIIFVTAHQEYAIEAFKLSAIDYLLKPVDPGELIAAVDRASEIIQQHVLKAQLSALSHNLGQSLKPKKIVINDMEGVHIIDVSQILWCKANGSYTEFQLDNGSKMVVSRHLKTFETMLSKYDFFRVHRSYLLNANTIVQVNRSQGMVVMKNEFELPVTIPPEALRIIIRHLQD